MKTALPAALAVLAAVTLGCGSSHRQMTRVEPPPPPSAAKRSAIRKLVLEAAAKMGDVTPANAVLIPTTRRNAELVDVATAEPDTPLYLVLVRGDFIRGNLLAVSIDARTTKSVGAGLVGAMPDAKAIGNPEPLLLESGPAGDIALTKNVPCPGDQPRVGPVQLRHLRAVTAVICGDGYRTYPGDGRWEISVRKVAVGDVAELQRYFERRSRPNLPKNGICLTNLEIVAPIAFVDAQGDWLVPRTPVDGCNHPLGGLPDLGRTSHLRWKVVSVRKIKKVGSG